MRLRSLATVAEHRIQQGADRSATLVARAVRRAVRGREHHLVWEYAWPAMDNTPSPYDGLYGRATAGSPGAVAIRLVLDASDAGRVAHAGGLPGSPLPTDAAGPLTAPGLWARALHDHATVTVVVPVPDAPAPDVATSRASTSAEQGPEGARDLRWSELAPLTRHPLVDTRAFAPRPSSQRFRRWLPVDESAPLVGVLAGDTGYSRMDLSELLRSWPSGAVAGAASVSVPSPVPVILLAGQDLRRTASGLPRGDGSASPLLLDDPGPLRRPVLLNALRGLLRPRPAEGPDDSPVAGPDWIEESRACGIPVLTVDAADTASLEEALRQLGDDAWRADRSRAERLEAVRRGTDHQAASVVAAQDARSSAASSLVMESAVTTSDSPSVPAAQVVRESRRVVVAGHDLKFAGGLIDHLRSEGHEVRLDHWTGHQRHDPGQSRSLARWADAVLCEWTLGNAVWYSRHAPSSTRLTTRLHLQESGLPFPGRVRQDRVDQFVFVADHIRRQVVRDHGIDYARTTVVPNAVTVPGDDLPLSGASPADRRFVLGMVGIVPARKGLHHALDLLARLRSVDPRFSLRIKGRLPSETSWMAERTTEAPYYRHQFARLTQDPLLDEAVHFDPFGPDMRDWYARIGVALSTSAFESFHFTLPDGAVHGNVPVSLAWPGADQLYPLDWLHASVEAMASRVLEVCRDAGTWDRTGRSAGEVVRQRYDARLVLPRLAREVLGG